MENKPNQTDLLKFLHHEVDEGMKSRDQVKVDEEIKLWKIWNLTNLLTGKIKCRFSIFDLTMFGKSLKNIAIACL